MAQPHELPPVFVTSASQPLIGIPLRENGHQVVQYFADEAAADRALRGRPHRRGRDLAGAWQALDPDMSWDQVADELHRLRHEARPTPPIDLDV
jgi:hypothetical protein